MAQVTDQIITTETAILEITYDDVTFDLVSVRLINTEPVTLRIIRKNGTAFRDLVVQSGEQTISFPAGPIRNLNDLNCFGLVVM